MPLAPFGEPMYLDRLAELVTVYGDGSVGMDARQVRWWGRDPAKLRGVADAPSEAHRDKPGKRLNSATRILLDPCRS